MSDVAEAIEAIDDLGRTFAEFRAENDKRLGDISKKGSADVLTVEKVERLNKRLDQIETAMRRAPRGEPGDGDKASETPETKAFTGYLRGGRDSLDTEEIKSLRLGDDAAAGFLAPTEYVSELIKGVVEYSPIRTVARVRPTARQSAQFPKKVGNFAAQWVAEQGTRSETSGLTYGLEEVPCHEMYALVDISAQLLEDSAFSLESELNAEFSEQFGLAEGSAFVNGNGAGKPEGFMQNSAVAFTVSGGTSTIADGDGLADGLITLYYAIKTEYAARGTWVMNRNSLSAIRKLKDSTTKSYVWQPPLALGSPATILGAPYVEAVDMPDQDTDAFPVAFGDFRRGYVIGDRITMSVLRDPYSQSTSGNIRFLARKRVGGQVVLAEAIRRLKCASS